MSDFFAYDFSIIRKIQAELKVQNTILQALNSGYEYTNMLQNEHNNKMCEKYGGRFYHSRYTDIGRKLYRKISIIQEEIYNLKNLLDTEIITMG